MTGVGLTRFCRVYLGAGPESFGRFPCAGLVVKSAFDAGLVRQDIVEKYERAINLNYVLALLRNCTERIQKPNAQPGDICAGGVLGQFTQVGILTEVSPVWRVIHFTDSVIEESLPNGLGWTLSGLFRFKNIDGI